MPRGRTTGHLRLWITSVSSLISLEMVIRSFNVGQCFHLRNLGDRQQDFGRTRPFRSRRRVSSAKQGEARREVLVVGRSILHAFCIRVFKRFAHCAAKLEDEESLGLRLRKARRRCFGVFGDRGEGRFNVFASVVHHDVVQSKTARLLSLRAKSPSLIASPTDSAGRHRPDVPFHGAPLAESGGLVRRCEPLVQSLDPGNVLLVIRVLVFGLRSAGTEAKRLPVPGEQGEEALSRVAPKVDHITCTRLMLRVMLLRLAKFLRVHPAEQVLCWHLFIRRILPALIHEVKVVNEHEWHVLERHRVAGQHESLVRHEQGREGPDH
eukprot:scaffold1299_cov246-Pinguiococcus_pyrenoidosus.AAC.4